MKIKSDAVMRRLKPLVLVNFFQGLILWYAIEKVFMSDIGFSAFLITVGVVVMSIVGLVVEVPAGVLADRWGRKKVLLLSMLFLFFATATFSFSKSIPVYFLGIILYGLFAASYSGLTDSIVYDTVVELKKSRSGYEKYYGYTRMAESAALITGSLIGGVTASAYGLRYAYVLTIPSCILAIVAAWFVVEPKVHHDSEVTYLTHHIRETFSHVWKRGVVGWTLMTIVSITIVATFLLEIDQLWPLALGLSLVLYGPLNALLLAGYGLGGYIADRIGKNRMTAFAACGLGGLAVALLSVRNMPIIALCQFAVIAIYSGLSIVANGKLHDLLPSRYRAGASSFVSTLTTIFFLPLLLIFGRIVEKTSVFSASYLLLPVAAIGIFGYLKITKTVEKAKA